jgi:ABC-2 type transport system permease protein
MTDFLLESTDAGPEAEAETRPFRWSVRRELWENRSLYLAPLSIAALFMFGFMVSTFGMPHRRRAVLLLDPAKQRAMIGEPYDVAAVVLVLIAFIVGAFYCLEALYGERRERSILFWKSLPVSDRTTVLSKASIPLVVLPLITLAIVVTLQFMMLLWSSLVLLPSGLSATTWTRFNLFEQTFILAYGLIVLALGHAPIYGWLLLVSSWARRAPILWAFLPGFVISMLEKMIFNTSYFGSMMSYRLIGFTADAFAYKKPHGTIDSISQLTPGRFLASPGLWAGLIFTAIFLAAAVRLRRNREPI